MERTVDVVGPNVGNGDHLHVVGADGAHQHLTLVAGANHSHPQRIAHLLIIEVHPAQTGSGYGTRGCDFLHEVATSHPHRFVVVILANRFLLCSQVHNYPSCRLGQHLDHMAVSTTSRPAN